MTIDDFYLGLHHPSDVRQMPEGTKAFVSVVTLRGYKGQMPKSEVPVRVDSGGFSEIAKHGAWVTEPEQYADECERIAAEVGMVETFFPQDWMCEPQMLRGRSVELHQAATISSLMAMRRLCPKLPFCPVLQGWTIKDYLTHMRMWRDVGFNLEEEPTVAIGSVCRRQATTEIGEIVYALHSEGLTDLHGLGVKLDGLLLYGQWLASSDSMAWSAAARRQQTKLPECSHRGICNNCLRYALYWRSELGRRLERAQYWKDQSPDLFWEV